MGRSHSSKKETPHRAKRKRVFWTPEEDKALVRGVKKYGKGRWMAIKNAFPDLLRRRSNVNIKDRYKTMLKNGLVDPNLGPPPTRSKNVSYTDEEKAAVLEGVRKFGHGNWRAIQSSFSVLSRRTNVNLKDCFRTMERRGEVPEGLLQDVDEVDDVAVATAHPMHNLARRSTPKILFCSDDEASCSEDSFHTATDDTMVATSIDVPSVVATPQKEPVARRLEFS